MDQMKRLFDSPDDSSLDPSPSKEDSSGFLSFSRVMSLDSMDVDLSKELASTPKSVVQDALDTGSSKAKNQMSKSPRWKLAPTRREQDKWDRATKAATGGSEVMFRELRRPRSDPEAQAAKDREQYFKLENKLQVLTVSIGGVGLVSAYISYTPEIALRILVPEYGVVPLELIPMLVGFFTYKIATFFQAIEEAISITSQKTESISPESEASD